MKLSIIGAGYVGLVSGAAFAELGHDVIIMDIDEEKIKKLNRGIIPIAEPGLERMLGRNSDRISFTTSIDTAVTEADIHFICVWTPPLEDGSADLSAVKAVAKELGETFTQHKARDPIIVTKSTVPVGTSREIRKLIRKSFKNDFNIVSNPEFLRESQAVADMLHPDRIVIGSDNEDAAKKVASIYADIKAPVIITDLASSEMIKYAANAFLATKISFANEVANVCEAVGADIDLVREGIGMDKRIGKSFLYAGMGYGGSCFPKDIRALHQFANSKGYDFKLLKSVIEVNDGQRELMITKLKKHLKPLRNKHILVLGLAFKAHTDDVRESAAIDFINRLLKLGVKISAYDPLALTNAKKVLGDSVNFVQHPHVGAKNVHGIVVATEWPEFRDLDWKHIKSQIKNPLVIDGRNLLDVDIMKGNGFTYEGVGRK